jgi:hypothetical protein
VSEGTLSNGIYLKFLQWLIFGKMSIINENLGSSTPSLSLTLNVESLSKIPEGGEPLNLGSDVWTNIMAPKMCQEDSSPQRTRTKIGELPLLYLGTFPIKAFHGAYPNQVKTQILIAGVTLL